jgi:hypothetical protein
MWFAVSFLLDTALEREYVPVGEAVTTEQLVGRITGNSASKPRSGGFPQRSADCEAAGKRQQVVKSQQHGPQQTLGATRQESSIVQ